MNFSLAFFFFFSFKIERKKNSTRTSLISSAVSISNQTNSNGLHSRIIVSCWFQLQFQGQRSRWVCSFRQNSINTSNVLARPVLPTAQILPVYPSRRTISFLTDPNQLPAIRDHMVKVNLNQRATFKCKSPAPIRPDSSLSRSTAGGPSSSTHQLKAFNPLKVYWD